MSSLQTIVAVLEEKVNNLCTQAEHFVSDDEFDPVKKIVYGMVGLILMTVMGALMVLVIRK